MLIQNQLMKISIKFLLNLFAPPNGFVTIKLNVVNCDIRDLIHYFDLNNYCLCRRNCWVLFPSVSCLLPVFHESQCLKHNKEVLFYFWVTRQFFGYNVYVLFCCLLDVWCFLMDSHAQSLSVTNNLWMKLMLSLILLIAQSMLAFTLFFWIKWLVLSDGLLERCLVWRNSSPNYPYNIIYILKYHSF